jgi:hypothetical protein
MACVLCPPPQKETRAQRMLEVYFWVGALVGLVLFALALALLCLPSDAAHVKALAASSPHRFRALARALHVDTAAGAGAVAAVERYATLYRVLTSSLAIALVVREHAAPSPLLAETSLHDGLFAFACRMRNPGGAPLRLRLRRRHRHSV